MTNKKGIKRLSVMLVVALLLSLVPATLTFAQESTSDTSKIEAFVERLYTIALGRASEAEGKAYWVDQLATKKKTAIEVVANFTVDADEFNAKGYTDDQFMDILYKVLMDREADATGKAYWLSQLAAGGSRLYVIYAMMLAPQQEFQAICDTAGIKVGRITIAESDYPWEIEVAVTGAKIISITSSKPLTSNDVVVKFGYLEVDGDVTVAEDGLSAEFVADNELMAGTYTANVKGRVIDIDVAAQKVVSLSIKTSGLQAGTGNAIVYEAINQYDEVYAIPASSIVATAYDGNNGTSLTISPADGKFTIADALVKDHSIMVNLFHAASGKSAQATYVVGAAAVVTRVELGEVSPLQGTSRIEAGHKGLVLPIKLFDQYNNEMALDAANLSKVMFISSNNLVVRTTDDGATVDNEWGLVAGNPNTLQFKALAAGETNITALVPASMTSTTVKITVYSAPVLKSIVLQQPMGLSVANEAIEIPYNAIDTFNAAMTLADKTQGGSLFWITNNPAVVDPTNDLVLGGDGKLYVTPKASGYVTISAYLGGVLQGAISLDVKPAAYVAKISGLSSDATFKFGVGGVYTYSVADFTFLDQYNRVVTPQSVLQLDEAALSVSVKAGATAGIVGSAGKQFTGAALGATTLTATYDEDGAGTAYAAKTFDYAVSVIPDSEIVDYKVSAPSSTLLRTSYGAEKDKYSVKVKITNGLDKDGNKVAVDGKFDLILGTGTNVKTDSNIATDTEIVLYAAPGTSNDASNTVSFWKSGKKIGEYTFKFSNGAPVPTTLDWNRGTVDTVAKGGTNQLAFTAYDQYAVAFTAAPAGVWMTTDSAIATVNNGLVTGVNAGKVTITYVSTVNGASISIDITVTE